jgi:hypothetical protein
MSETPASAPNRGVDLDAIAITPLLPLEALIAAADSTLDEQKFEKLASIDAILMDELMEWLLPGERCVALTEPQGDYRIVYDTTFSHGALADGLAKVLPEALIVQFNVQEQVDFTLRILRGERTLYEYSNAPSFFKWGRCLAKNEVPQLARPETAALAAALNCPQKAALLEDCFTTISAKIPGEKSGTRGRHRGGVYDAVQAIAAHAGMPRLYRFFEGWMKSDLDWDEDNVEIVKAYRRNNA